MHVIHMAMFTAPESDDEKALRETSLENVYKWRISLGH